MRVSRAVRSALAGLGAGYATGLLAAFWLKAAVPDGDLIWNLVSPLRIGAWMLEAAHGVPTVIRSAAGLQAPDASVDRLGELLGGSSDVVFTFSLVLVPISILAIAGITTAVFVRRAAPASGRQLAMWAAAGAATYGLALGLFAWLTSFTFTAAGNLAPDLGLGGATGHLAIGIGHAPVLATLIGAVWGTAFVLAGGLSALPMRTAIDSDDRVVLRAWLRGLGSVSGAIAALMLVGGIVAALMGKAPSPALVGLGGLLLGANAVAAALVFCNGVSMSVALDAGPFTGWERVDFLHVGTAGGAAPPYVWLAVLVPLAAGVIAGRSARKRSAYSARAIAIRFGVLWGLTLAVLALLLRVRVLSSFSVGGLDLGGGSAAFDPLIALVWGTVVGSVAAFIGARSSGATETWTCPSCGITNTPSDRFCVSCGSSTGDTRSVAPSG